MANLLDLLVLAFFIGLLLVTIVISLKTKFRFTKSLGNILGLFYITFFFAAVLIQILYLTGTLKQGWFLLKKYYFFINITLKIFIF